MGDDEMTINGLGADAALDHAIDYADDDQLPAAFRSDCGFLTGPAGCGKTFLSKALCAPRSGWTMAASTGIAAVNLGEATTINSLLGYFDRDSLRSALVQGWVQAKLKKLHGSGLERVILDEVSMVDGESLTLIVEALDELRRDDGIDIGLTLVGDFCQLPPVPEKLPHAQGRRKTLPAAFAFEAAVWDRFAANVTTLTEIKRQADPAFIEGLRACRRGDVPAMAAYFGPRCQMTIDDDYPGLTIFSKNDQVDRWNALMHARVKGAAATFNAVRDREQKTEWRKHIPDVLELREGALVMVLANKILGGGSYIQYANGDLGTFRGAEDKEVTVVDEEGRATKEKVRCARVELQRTLREVLVEPVVRHNLVPTGALGVKKARYQVIGSISYMPLRLAYASTVHKIQGLSLDHVQVAFADPFFGSPAMLYVAMSRARSAEGLRLVGTPQLLRERCAVDGRVRSWL